MKDKADKETPGDKVMSLNGLNGLLATDFGELIERIMAVE